MPSRIAHAIAQTTPDNPLMRELRDAGPIAGVNLFSYDGVHTRSHYLDTLARGVFASRAATPRMRWLPSRDTVAKPAEKRP